jgi:hypothetical protein
MKKYYSVYNYVNTYEYQCKKKLQKNGSFFVLVIPPFPPYPLLKFMSLVLGKYMKTQLTGQEMCIA